MHFTFLEANEPVVSHMLSSDRTQARARSPSGAAPGTVKDAQPARQPVGLCSSSANDSTLTRSSAFTTTSAFALPLKGKLFIHIALVNAVFSMFCEWRLLVFILEGKQKTDRYVVECRGEDNV